MHLQWNPDVASSHCHPHLFLKLYIVMYSRTSFSQSLFGWSVYGLIDPFFRAYVENFRGVSGHKDDVADHNRWKEPLVPSDWGGSPEGESR